MYLRTTSNSMSTQDASSYNRYQPSYSFRPAPPKSPSVAAMDVRKTMITGGPSQLRPLAVSQSGSGVTSVPILRRHQSNADLPSLPPVGPSDYRDLGIHGTRQSNPYASPHSLTGGAAASGYSGGSSGSEYPTRYTVNAGPISIPVMRSSNMSSSSLLPRVIAPRAAESAPFAQQQTTASVVDRRYGLSEEDEVKRETQEVVVTRAPAKVGHNRYANAGLCGLRNLGNTCFMNSIIQCLSNTAELTEYCLSGAYRQELNVSTSTVKGALMTAFAELLASMWETGSGRPDCVSPAAFKAAVQKFAPRFTGYNQQDSQEFLRYLLQGLQEDVSRIRQRSKVKPLDDKSLERLAISERAEAYWRHYQLFENSKIADIFVGQLRSTLRCQVCSYESIAFDPFWDISLPVTKTFNTKVDLLQCVGLFMKEELLDGAEQARCDRCQKLRPCAKRFTVERFPRVLVLHLKRFSQNSYGTKLTTMVEFPITGLNLAQFAADQNVANRQVTTYDLYAVSNHSGSMYSGHYTAYCRHPYNSRWYEYNDSRVNSVSTSSIQSPEAYVLFYEQAGG